jgi:hypothetical protein
VVNLEIVPNKTGYTAVVGPDHQLLGLWLDGDVREGGDDYDAEDLWRSIGQQTRGEIPKVQSTGDMFSVEVFNGVATLLLPSPLRTTALQLLADATEHWFDVVNIPVAAALRRIRQTWQIDK